MQKKDLVNSCCCHKDTAGGEHSPVGVGWGGVGGALCRCRTVENTLL